MTGMSYSALTGAAPAPLPTGPPAAAPAAPAAPAANPGGSSTGADKNALHYVDVLSENSWLRGILVQLSSEAMEYIER